MCEQYQTQKTGISPLALQTLLFSLAKALLPSVPGNEKVSSLCLEIQEGIDGLEAKMSVKLHPRLEIIDVSITTDTK